MATTLFTAKFESDDDELVDEDYVAECSSNSEEEAVENKSDKRSNKRKRDQKTNQTLEDLRSIKRTKRLSHIYNTMFNTSLQEFKHEPAVLPDPFMIQFYRRYPQTNKKRNTTKQDLLHHLNISVSKIESSKLPPPFDLQQFKESCRTNNVNFQKESIQAAIRDSAGSNRVKIKKEYFFAGKMHHVEQYVDKDSNQYKAYMKRNQSTPDQMKFIDSFLSKHQDATKMSVIAKSDADWQKYKEAYGVEDLKSKEAGFLDRQEFLAKTEWRKHLHDLKK